MHSALKTERPKFFDYVLSKGYDVQKLDWKEIAKLYCEVRKWSIELTRWKEFRPCIYHRAIFCIKLCKSLQAKQFYTYWLRENLKTNILVQKSSGKISKVEYLKFSMVNFLIPRPIDPKLINFGFEFFFQSKIKCRNIYQ